MPPLPKPPSQRQRRNRTSTAATLTGETRPILAVPDLPARGRRKWHPFTLSWWEDVRSSPMVPEYLQSDLHGLYLLADLVDQYWRASDARKSTTMLAAEIRQQGQRFGLSPMDRRRLQWATAKP